MRNSVCNKNKSKVFLKINIKRPLRSLKDKIILELVLNRERNLKSQKDFFNTTLYLYNLDFENNNHLIVDLYNDGYCTGAQIRLDIEFRWMDFEEPLNELKQIKEFIIEQLNNFDNNIKIYLNQIRYLLLPFDPNNPRFLEFSYHNPFISNYTDKKERKNVKIFEKQENPMDILNDYLLYSGIRRIFFYL